MTDFIADLLISLYKANRKTLCLRGGYRGLILASHFLPKLRRIPISFPSTETYLADVQKPDTYWLLNSYLEDGHESIAHLSRILIDRSIPNAVVWDIGGSMGTFTISMLTLEPNLHEIHLFEPNPIPRKVAVNLLGNHPKVRIHSYALGDKQGTGILTNGAESKGTGGGSLVNHRNKNDGFTVDIKTGDDLVDSECLLLPDIIKIDVEGYEKTVLQGMQKIIASNKPLIAIEILFISQEEISKVIPHGYRIRYIRESDGKLFDDYETAQLGDCMDAILEPIENYP